MDETLDSSSPPPKLDDVGSGLLTPKPIPHTSPGGTTKEWIPCCPPEMAPFVGMRFESLEDGISFYRKYAYACGFSVRLGGDKKTVSNVVTLKYIVCNREGFKPVRNICQASTSSEGGVRRRVVNRFGCRAKIVFKLNIEGFYTVLKFYEGHNHLLATPSIKQFMKERRKLTSVHKKIITNNANLNIGASKSFRLFKEYVGGYENVGATLQDFKNHSRDIKCYIGESDSDMILNIFRQKNEGWSGYYYDYMVDDSGILLGAFWADPISRKNYALFGDMISFDCTYSTNKYNMIFAPFTGVDHHKKCVTFGAGLIAHENIGLFQWLFETFLRAMGNIEPCCLITDQDPAMKIAIERVFKKAQHRFCMWHIMKKVNDKVSHSVRDSDFKAKLSACVWSLELEPDEFECRWMGIISEYGLECNEWLSHMFEIRNLWIPAYFRDLFMGGLLRTTSRSESENSFFGNFTNPHCTLVEFIMRYESALDGQRYKQSELNKVSCLSYPELKTPLQLEKHASEIYTHTIFYEFQSQILSASFSCGFNDFQRDGDLEITEVNDIGVSNSKSTFKVICNSMNHDIKCSCKLFERCGIPCKHILWVLKGKGVEHIPTQLVVNRWTKTALKKPIFDLEGNPLKECCKADDMKTTLSRLWSQMFECVSLVEGKEESIHEFIRVLEDFKEEWCVKNKNDKPSSKSKIIESLIGTSAPTEVTIQVPQQSKNKGSGKRIKGEKEKAMEQQKKRTRQCKACGECAGHDSRNCPAKLKKK